MFNRKQLDLLKNELMEIASTGQESSVSQKPIGRKSGQGVAEIMAASNIRPEKPDTRSLEQVARDIQPTLPEKQFGYGTPTTQTTATPTATVRRDVPRNNTGISQGGVGPEADPAHAGDADYGPRAVPGHDTQYNGPGVDPNYNGGSDLAGVDENRPTVPPINTNTRSAPQQQPRGTQPQANTGSSTSSTSQPQPRKRGTPPGPNAGKVSPTYNPGGPSINPDGSFNISPQAQAQAQANRDAMTTARATDAERTRRLGVPPQQGVQGYDASGRTIKPNSSFRYVNPNSPEGRIEASIAAGNEPDMKRDSSGRIITNARGVQDPNAVGYAAGEKAYQETLRSELQQRMRERQERNNQNQQPTPRRGSRPRSGDMV